MMSIQLRTRDKLLIGGPLAIFTMAAWVAMFNSSLMMYLDPIQQNMTGIGTSPTGLRLLLYLGTWTVMMIAMMLPSAAPMILTYSVVSQKQRSGLLPQVDTLLFTLGYMLAWGSLGLLAYALNNLLPLLQLIAGLDKYSWILPGGVLVLAGAYQFSSLKDICLTACRTPLGYLMTHWRKGHGGAIQMGLQHGLYCIGCCWALMLLLFLVGIMNLAWMAGLSLVFFIEKVSQRGVMLSRVLGVILILAGLAVTFHGLQ